MARSLLQRFCVLAQIELLRETADGSLIPYFDDTEGSTLVSDARLREKLREGAGEEAKPYLYQDEYQVYYAVLPQKDGWLYAGPMCSARLSAARRRQFYRAHGVSAEDTRPLRAFSLREIADIPPFRHVVRSGLGRRRPALFPADARENRAGNQGRPDPFPAARRRGK